MFYRHRNASPRSRAKKGSRAWVILHSYTHPLNTYLIAPITSNPGVPNTCVPIEQANYPDILTHDSYVDLRFITVVNTEFLRVQKGLDSTKRPTVVLATPPTLNPTDIARVDLGAIMALELGDVIQGLVEKEKDDFAERLKEDFESNLKIALEKISDTPTRELIQTLFNDLLYKVLSKK